MQDLPREPEYDDFRNIVAVREAVASAMQEESIARFVCVEGENGCGKDASLKAMLRSWPKVTVPVEADEIWRDSLAAPLADIINALAIKRQKEEGAGGFKMPPFPLQRRELILEELNRRKVILGINEAASMGHRGMNFFKTVINKTKSVVVFFCIPVLLDRLIRTGYEEAAQLFGNRLCRRVRLEAPASDEILTLCERRGIKFDSAATAGEFTNRLETESPAYGNWRFVIRTTRKAILQSGGGVLTMGKLSDCLTEARRDCIDQQLRERKSQ